MVFTLHEGVQEYEDLRTYVKETDEDDHTKGTDGNDDSYYLTHTFKKTEHAAGAIFLDSDNNADFSDDKNIIYGHNILWIYIAQWKEK